MVIISGIFAERRRPLMVHAARLRPWTGSHGPGNIQGVLNGVRDHVSHDQGKNSYFLYVGK